MQESAAATERREATMLRMIGLKMLNGILYPVDANTTSLAVNPPAAEVAKLGGVNVKVPRTADQPIISVPLW